MKEAYVELIFTFFRFSLVGLSGMFIDFTLTYFFKERLKISKYVSNSIGFVAAASSNFVLNRVWTFASDDPYISIQYFKFFIVSLIGLFLNNIIVKLLHETVEWNFYASKLVAIGIVLSWNFAINLIVTFN